MKLIYYLGAYMNKKIFAAIMSVLFLLNSICAFGLTESNIQKLDPEEELNQEQSSSHAIYILPVGVGVIAVAAVLLNSVFNNGENHLKINENPIESWEYVGRLYFQAAKEEKNSRRKTAEYYEHLADCYRCLLHLKKICDKEREECYSYASECFRLAYVKYNDRAQRYKNDKSPDGVYQFQINSAKAAEMLAKKTECPVVVKMPFLEGMDNEGIAAVWGEVVSKKPSYDAYARAKQLEYSSTDPLKIAAAWEAVKNDQDLRESFSEDSWEAYKAFAEANRQEWLLRGGQTKKEQVAQVWKQACEKDIICAKKPNCFIYYAFAAEAYQRAQDALSAK